MVSIKTTDLPDRTVVAYGSIRGVGDRRAKTRSAALNAVRIADWVAIHRGASRIPKKDRLGEHELFSALQACAYQATRKPRGKGAASADRDQWAKRWGMVRNFLVDQNVGLVHKMVGRLQASPMDLDDLRSEAFLALLRSVERYDPWRGVRFSTYACHAIWRSGIQAIKRSKRDAMKFVAEPDTLSPPASQCGRWAELSVDRLRRALDENRGDLTERESKVLAGRFPLGGRSRRTLLQIGAALELSKERVRQIQNEALAKLRGVLQVDPFLQ